VVVRTPGRRHGTALQADVRIYTGVGSVFTPTLGSTYAELDEVSYDEMLELAAAGARVLMPRSVEFGKRFNIPIHVRSAFHDGPGTWVKETVMEQPIVSGVAHDVSEAKITVRGIPDQPGVAAALFGALADAGIRWTSSRPERFSGGV
jgi:aspartate kinase